MKDKYLGKDGIDEKYDFKCNVIKCVRNAGTIAGAVYSMWGVSNEDLRETLIGAGICVGSYILGSYINKINENKKQKALKNIETALEGDKK